MKPEKLNELICRRRSIFPNTYNDRPIPDFILQQILENANWAPTHRLTEPWRFRVFQGEARQRLSDYMGDWYVEHTPAEKYSEKKLEKTKAKPLQSSAIIAICMQRDPEAKVPEWEEVAAVACAVQNMWLSCAAYGIGAYWSSPQSIMEAEELLQLKEGERCLGLFYMGYHNLPNLPGKRSAIEDKTIWITA